MREYFTEAIVLDKKNSGEFDARVFLYTKELGRVAAKITSARKIISKLNPHLEPLNIVDIRLVHKNSFQVIDALRKERLSLDFLKIIKAVQELTMENEPDFPLWTILQTLRQKNYPNISVVLNNLGYSPELASCVICDKNPSHFSFKELSFYCNGCAIQDKTCLKI